MTNTRAYWSSYLDTLSRYDQRGQGVACGKGWISRDKKCSKGKAATTPKEALERTKQKAKERHALSKKIKESKGMKPTVIEKEPQATKPKVTFSELQGSEKQVAWAKEIRAKKLRPTFHAAKNMGLGLTNKQIVDALNEETDAKFWIENQFSDPVGLALYVAWRHGKLKNRTGTKVSLQEVESVRSQMEGRVVTRDYEATAIPIYMPDGINPKETSPLLF